MNCQTEKHQKKGFLALQATSASWQEYKGWINRFSSLPGSIAVYKTNAKLFEYNENEVESQGTF